jgi:hypothetical protein
MKKLIIWLAVGFTTVLLLAGAASHAAKADHVFIAVDPVTTNSANPDRRRITGAALILESDGTINEPSIPFNAIKPTSASVPQNTIVNGELEGMDAPIKQELIVQ